MHDELQPQPLRHRHRPVLLDEENLSGEDIRAMHFVKLMKDARIARSKEEAPFNEVSSYVCSAAFSSISDRMLIQFLREFSLFKNFQTKIIAKLFEAVSPKVSSLPPTLCAEVLRAAGILHFVEDSLFDELESKIEHVLCVSPGTMSDRDLTLCAMGLGEARRHTSRIPSLLVENISTRLDTFETKQISTILWGIAPIISTDEMKVLWPMTDRIAEGRGIGRINESLRLAYLAGMFHGLENELLTKTARIKPLRSHMFNTLEENERPKTMNSFEREIFSVLDSLGIEAEPQVSIHGISVDFFIPVRKGASAAPIAIFCDGVRFHYLNYRLDGELCGSDFVNNRVLERLGYAVVRLADHELPNLEEDLKSFLVDRLIESQKRQQ